MARQWKFALDDRGDIRYTVPRFTGSRVPQVHGTMSHPPRCVRPMQQRQALAVHDLADAALFRFWHVTDFRRSDRQHVAQSPIASTSSRLVRPHGRAPGRRCDQRRRRAPGRRVGYRGRGQAIRGGPCAGGRCGHGHVTITARVPLPKGSPFAPPAQRRRVGRTAFWAVPQLFDNRWMHACRNTGLAVAGTDGVLTRERDSRVGASFVRRAIAGAPVDCRRGGMHTRDAQTVVGHAPVGVRIPPAALRGDRHLAGLAVTR